MYVCVYVTVCICVSVPPKSVGRTALCVGARGPDSSLDCSTSSGNSPWASPGQRKIFCLNYF